MASSAFKEKISDLIFTHPVAGVLYVMDEFSVIKI